MPFRWEAAQGVFRGAVGMIWPATCPLTGAEVARPASLAAAAHERLDFCAAPWCSRCGRPFEDAQPEDALCAGCSAEDGEGLAPVPRRAAVAYDDVSRDLILAFKHGDREEFAPVFARWMARVGAEFFEDADMIVPAPLHPVRLLRRRRNQAADLARHVARLSGLPHRPDILRRVRATPSQGGLSKSARRRNVRGAFRVMTKMRGVLEGRGVVILDDVITTGATLHACAAALKKAGAARVYGLSVAARF